jgi:hypothetical protein
MHIKLTHQQAAELRELLQSSLSDLSAEIAGTDNAGYREGLRARRASLEEVLLELGGTRSSRAEVQ